MSTLAGPDSLYLWWLADPARPRWVGTLRLVRRSSVQPGGVSLTYAPDWLADGQALSEDLPLQAGEFLPASQDAAAGAVDDARPDRWGERVIRLMDRPPRLSTLDYLYHAGDERFGALGVSTSSAEFLPRRHGPLPALPDLQALSDLVRRVETGEPVAEAERRLVTPGTTLGGARPKALLNLDGETWVVKFAEQGDVVGTPLIQHATMTLAASAGIQVCETRALPIGTGPSVRHAIAIRRFDRLFGFAASARAVGPCRFARRRTGIRLPRTGAAAASSRERRHLPCRG